MQLGRICKRNGEVQHAGCRPPDRPIFQVCNLSSSVWARRCGQVMQQNLLCMSPSGVHCPGKQLCLGTATQGSQAGAADCAVSTTQLIPGALTGICFAWHVTATLFWEASTLSTAAFCLLTSLHSTLPRCAAGCLSGAHRY